MKTSASPVRPTPAARRRALRQTATGLAFLAPNILGFMTFTLLPLVFSLVLAFTNWDIRFHNMFKDVPLQFVGFQNFVRLFHEPDFPKYLGNTLFLMMNVTAHRRGTRRGSRVRVTPFVGRYHAS